MRKLTAEPITTEAFARFGVLLERPDGFGRQYFDQGLSNLRPAAWPSLSIAAIAPLTGLTFDAVRMERHAFSSQSFIPMHVARYLVLVAPHAADGGPDAGETRAFVARGDQAITYRADVWHHPMVALDRPRDLRHRDVARRRPRRRGVRRAGYAASCQLDWLSGVARAVGRSTA